VGSFTTAAAALVLGAPDVGLTAPPEGGAFTGSLAGLLLELSKASPHVGVPLRAHCLLTLLSLLLAAPVSHICAGDVRESHLLRDGAQTDGHLLLLLLGVHEGLCVLLTMRVHCLRVDVAIDGEGLLRQEGLHLHTKSMVGRRSVNILFQASQDVITVLKHIVPTCGLYMNHLNWLSQSVGQEQIYVQGQ
jgi:hypothetical protein